MAETDILNPLNWKDYGWFNPNPSYGFTRKPTNNRQIQRPRMGPYNSRDLMNGGHIFSLSWIGVPLETADRISAFYHNFKDGYFTLIDVDARQRQYVGRFTNEPNPAHTANGKYNVEGVVFEEMPTARMVQYPCDFKNDGHPLYVVDDFLKPRVALMQGNWITQVSPLSPGGSASAPSVLEAFDLTPAAGDWAQTQYVGWGFQMSLRMGATLGKVNISLDDTAIVTELDLSTGVAAALNTGVTATQVAALVPGLPGTVLVKMVNVPLDQHRVKIASAGASTAGGSSIVYPALEYIY